MSRVAIVTGAARGIGAATVDALVNDGYRVIAVDRCRNIPEVPYQLASSADLDAVVAHHGDSVLGLVGDVRSASDMQLAVETATRHFGRLDAVVACAGVVAGGAPIWELTDAAWDAVWSVNVLGTRRLIEAAAPTLIANGKEEMCIRDRFSMMNQEIRGTVFGSTAPRLQIPKLLRLHHEGKFMIDELVTQEYSLDEVQKGYEDLEAGKNIRGVVRL